MKSYSTQEPKVLEKCYGSRYLYHWDIENEEVEDEDGTHVQYAYNEVAVYAPLSCDKLLKTVINELWDKDFEQKLVNDYNAHLLGVGDESVKDAYLTFLQERARIKAQVESDCKDNGID